MPVAELHVRIDEIASRAALDAGVGADPDVVAVEEHASAGCSVCARALVNARDLAAEMALLAPTRSPSHDLRGRILERTSTPEHISDRPPAPRGLDGALAAHRSEPRIFDPSGTVAHMHVTGEGEAERAAEVSRLAAHTAHAGDATERVLAQVERIGGFPLHFVSIIRGERVGYRVQRGLGADVKANTGMRREMTFCTHCVSSDGPLVIKNTVAEPFFRTNPAVTRHRIRAYVGVPLRLSTGIIVGTLCALDYRPRTVGPDFVRVLELFAQRVVAEIERPRSAEPLGALVLDPPAGSVYRQAWFEALVEALQAGARAATEARPASLITISGGSPEDRAFAGSLAKPDEVVGAIGDDALGILLSGASDAQAKERASALEAAMAGRGGIAITCDHLGKPRDAGPERPGMA